MYGIYSSVSKKHVFGIREPTKSKAWKALYNKIGKDAFKVRFQISKLKGGGSMGNMSDYYALEADDLLYETIKNKKRRNAMMTQSTRIVTGEVRFSYVNLLKPRESQYGGEPKYSVTILVPKTDVATKQRIDAAIEAAKEIGKSKVWNGVIPPMVSVPVHDGDGARPSDGMPYGNECKGHWVFTASCKTDYPPKVVDANLNPIIDPTEVYSGMYGRIAINFAPYNQNGKKGVGAYISTNVQKTRDGEPLGAAAPAAADDFGAPAPQQQAPQQQPHYDPITGQLIGGVHGA